MEKNEKTLANFARLMEVARKALRAVAKYSEYTAETGEVLIIDGDPETGKVVKIRDAEGNEINAPDGVYALVGENRTVTVSGGMISEVVEVEVAKMDMGPVADALEKVVESIESMNTATVEMQKVNADQLKKAEEDAEAIKARFEAIEAKLEVLGKTTSVKTAEKKAEFSHPGKLLTFAERVSLKNHK